MSGWRLIGENTPKDRLILCWREGWDLPAFLMWKADAYYGDPCESDDYELRDESKAMYWFDITPPPGWAESWFGRHEKQHH